MNQKKAIAEAKRRWGPHGHAINRPGQFPGVGSYRVGYVAGHDIGMPMFLVRGMGDSWEAAFADADKSEPKVQATREDAKSVESPRNGA